MGLGNREGEWGLIHEIRPVSLVLRKVHPVLFHKFLPIICYRIYFSKSYFDLKAPPWLNGFTMRSFFNHRRSQRKGTEGHRVLEFSDNFKIATSDADNM